MKHRLLAAAALSLSIGTHVTPRAVAGPTITLAAQDDQVSLSLALEDWVETQTARTEVAVDAALPGADAGKARAQMLAAVKELAQGAVWRFTAFDHASDTSGLERWHGILEARLPEAQLGGLSDRAKQASKPGLQLTVQTIDFSPTLAELEVGKAKLRGEMYKKINESLQQLNQAEPDRKFRIRTVEFGHPPAWSGESAADMAAPKAMFRSADEQQPTGSVVRSAKITLTANITFAALPPHD